MQGSVHLHTTVAKTQRNEDEYPFQSDPQGSSRLLLAQGPTLHPRPSWQRAAVFRHVLGDVLFVPFWKSFLMELVISILMLTDTMPEAGEALSLVTRDQDVTFITCGAGDRLFSITCSAAYHCLTRRLHGAIHDPALAIWLLRFGWLQPIYNWRWGHSIHAGEDAAVVTAALSL